MKDKQVETRAALEIRQTRRNLVAVILQEGRSPTHGPPEVFVPESARWESDGIAIRDGHDGAEIARAVPERTRAGRLRVKVRANGAIRAALAAGRDKMSVEFIPIQVRRTQAGVTEILRALITGAALTDKPAYGGGVTSAELRERDHRAHILELLK